MLRSLITRNWNRFVATGFALTLALVPAFAAQPAPALAAQPAEQAATYEPGPTCVYIFGEIDGELVTTPAVIIPVPEVEVGIDLISVVVDRSQQKILGYKLNLPGIDIGTPDQHLYIPGGPLTIPSLSPSLLNLTIEQEVCVQLGVTVPAVPVKVPETVLEIPGGEVTAPEIYLHIGGIERTVGGRTVSWDGQTIVIPGVDTTTPAIPISTPDKTISVVLDGTIEMARYMPPR